MVGNSLIRRQATLFVDKDQGRKMNDSASKIRLAQIIYALCLGGSEVLAWRLAKSLKGSAQYDCSLFGIAHGGPLAPLLAADGIPSQAFARSGRVDFSFIARLAW